MNHLQPVIDSLKKEALNRQFPDIKVYAKSYTDYDGVRLVMVKDKTAKWIVVTGEGQLYDDLNGKTLKGEGKICPLSHENRLVLNRYFDYTVPQAFGTEIATIGLGDRLGLASPGHIEIIRNKNIKPILAQQSIRELTLTDRTMEDIVDAASFAVFQEGYKGGFGADGDHLKEESDIKLALSLGMSMLTLDCSDYIQNGVEEAPIDQVREAYGKLPGEVRDYYSATYLNKVFNVNGLSVSYNEEELMRNALIYRRAVIYMVHVYDNYISKEKREIDFEISIDETKTVTSPEQHFFVASELKLGGIEVTSLAPRFCGEFQKGIDYIGDIDQFEQELEAHAQIAQYFGYKLSIHSGSDKFKVFPIIYKHTNKVFHLKTAGTNWLEAIRVIANVHPNLYRKMHQFALDNFVKAQEYYHVTPDLESIKPLNEAKDEELSDYMNDDAARQLFHITYGLLLTAKDNHGGFLFKDELFGMLNEHEEDYREALIHHIGKHITLLGL